MPALPLFLRSEPPSWPYPGGTALVTGASSGIGEALARALAARGMSLLLAALPREEPALRAIADELTLAHDVRVELAPVDLTEPGAPERLRSIADQAGFELDLLVNCAGMGIFGPFTVVPAERQLAMVRLNIEANVALTATFLPRMIERRRGAVLLVASTSAFQPMPYHAVYAASKAFLLRFGEALWAECHRHGVRVVTVCPGPVADTRFAAYQYVETPKFRTITRDEVVRAALDGIARDQPVVTCRVRGGGAMYAVGQVSKLVLPRRRQLALMERVLRLTPRDVGQVSVDRAERDALASSANSE